jgi:hypothetical protein
MRTFPVPILAALLLTLAACPGGTAKPEPIKAQSFAQTYASTLCQRAAYCQSNAPYLEEQCEQLQAHFLGPDDLTKAIAAGRIEYDEALARACVDGLKAGECLSEGQDDATRAACLGALKGKVATGQPCYSYYECAQGFCGGSCPATCPEVLKEGEECFLHGGTPCDERAGLHCANGVCAKTRAAGQACLEDRDCGSGTICVQRDRNDPESGVCSPLSKEGESCSGDASCEAGLYCSATRQAGLCAKRLGEGHACGDTPEDINAALRNAQCADGLICKGAGLTSEGDFIPGYCARPAAEGTTCASESGGVFQNSGCQEGLLCPGGICSKPPTHGLCSIHGSCQPGVAYCDENNQCQPLKALGEACGQSPECKTGYCGENGCAEPVPYCHEP